MLHLRVLIVFLVSLYKQLDTLKNITIIRLLIYLTCIVFYILFEFLKTYLLNKRSVILKNGTMLFITFKLIITPLKQAFITI